MLLSLLIFLPFAYALLVMLLPEKFSRPVSLALSGIHFVFSLILLARFDVGTPDLQFVERIEWVKSFGIHYFVGIDGISLWLVLLTTFLTPLTILGSWTAISKKVKGFHVAMLALEATMIGTFLAMDAVLFYVFFEASLIPMYFMIGIWGGARRIYATVK
ncbi:MAG: Fe-S-binding domain-containing protein, partial [Pseudomonadota bacterium]